MDELETYLDEIDRDSSHLFNKMVAIVLYVDDVFMLSKSKSRLTKTFEQAIQVLHFLDVNISKPKIMNFSF
jgi:hypothetical protein